MQLPCQGSHVEFPAAIIERNEPPAVSSGLLAKPGTVVREARSQSAGKSRRFHDGTEHSLTWQPIYPIDRIVTHVVEVAPSA